MRLPHLINPSKLAGPIVAHPGVVITATLLLTALSLASILRHGVGFNGSLETLSRKDVALQFYNETKAIFGDDRAIIIALTTRDVFDRDFLDRLARLTSELQAIKGIEEVQSLANIKGVQRTGNSVLVDRLIPRDATADQLQALKSSITSDPLYGRNYVSRDGRTAAIDVFLGPLTEEQLLVVAGKVETTTEPYGEKDELLLAGAPIMDARGISAMIRDMGICSPIAILVCLAAFFLCFRSFWGAVLPVSALAMGLIWVTGLMSLMGRPITFATLPLPTVLLAVGASYMFHVLNQFRVSMAEWPEALAGPALSPAQRKQWQKREWHGGLTFIMPAVFVSGLTTMAGFGALASSSIPTVKDMGLFESAGVLAMLILTITFIPAMLAVLPPQCLGRINAASRERPRWLIALMRHVTALIMFRRYQTLIFAGLAAVLMGLGIPRLQINTDYLKIFPPKSDIVKSARLLHERLAGAATIEVVVGGPDGSIYDPAFLNQLAGLQEFAVRQPGVDSAISIRDILARLNGVLDPGEPPGIPGDRVKVKKLFDEFLSNEPDVSRLADVTSGSAGRAVILLRTNLFSSNELRKLTDNIDGWSKGHLSAGLWQRSTGSVVLLNDASDAVAESQISSLALALATILLVMICLFGSVSTGFLALVPNLLPIIGYFGFLGWTGIPLDITTSLIATAALGLAVDNAVHMIRRYRQCSQLNPDEGWAMWLTMQRTGRPMVLANLTLLAGFLVFILSSFGPVRLAGLLWAVTIAACLAANLILLPALMKSGLFAKAALGRSTGSVEPISPITQPSD